MNTVNIPYVGLSLFIILFVSTKAKTAVKDGEIEVRLQFLEYELEDLCTSKSEAEWKFLNGSEHDLKKFLDVEIKESELYKQEFEVLQKHSGKKFSDKKLQRLMNVFFRPGAYLLDAAEFKEYRDYTLKLEELSETMTIERKRSKIPSSAADDTFNSTSLNQEENSINRKEINKILYNEKNEQKLRDVWTRWYQTLEERNKKTKYDFVQQLSILDLEAEQNGEEELTEHWLKQSDTTWINYETIKNIWEKIGPLYDKLKQFLKSLVIKNFGENVLYDQETIPAYVLGSLETYDWVTAAEKLNAFENFDPYKTMKIALEGMKVADLYKMADNLTAELKIGYLPPTFYEKSHFNESSQTCRNKIMKYCERENILRAMHCANEAPNINQYLLISKNVMKIKHQLLCGQEEEENGFLFREGPRDSALYEAMEALSSLRAVWPEKLPNQQLLTNQNQQQKNVYSLFVSALHILPKLPYYLASDLWRINALREIDASVGEHTDSTSLSPPPYTPHSGIERDRVETESTSFKNESQAEDNPGNSNSSLTENEPRKTYDTQALTKDWWTFRLQYQGIGPPKGKFYEDYLQDKKIIWNKPYLSKFLGNILLFQILEKTNNLTDVSKIPELLRKGKSKSWQSLVQDAFNITEISPAPLLRYFKPLEEVLDKGMKVKNQNQVFNFDDFNFVSQGFSLNPTNGEGEVPAEGSDALFFSLAVVAAVGVVALIVTIGRRRYKKRQRMRERKRRLAEL